MKLRTLWIEDGAVIDLQNMLGPLYVSGKYDLVIALDASEGIRRVMQSKFDAIIVDIRIPPGDDREWIDLFSQSKYNKVTARLGLALLDSLLKPERAKIKLDSIPEWVSAERFGVLTVESPGDLKEDLDHFNIAVYTQKTASIPITTLVEMFDEITGQRQ